MGQVKTAISIDETLLEELNAAYDGTITDEDAAMLRGMRERQRRMAADDPIYALLTQYQLPVGKEQVMAQQVEDARAAQEQRFKMSYEEFMEWDTDSIHAEWVNGEVTVFMPPTTIHQRVSLLLSTLLSLYARSFNMGEVLVAPFEMRLWPGRSSREPDILFLAREHQDELTPKRLEGPADLVVEFVSDSSVARDRDDKFYEYQEAGVREYWIIDPRPGKQRADVYQLTSQGTYQAVLPDPNGHYHAAVLPGFWFDPDWLWQEPLPDAVMLLAQIAPQALRDALKAIATPPDDELQ